MSRYNDSQNKFSKPCFQVAPDESQILHQSQLLKLNLEHFVRLLLI